MRTTTPLLVCLLAAACGDSSVEVTEARPAKSGATSGSELAGEAPVDLGDGLVLTVLARGGGDFAKSGGRVRVHYTASVVAVNEPEAETAAPEEPEDAPPAEEVAAETPEAPGADAGTSDEAAPADHGDEQVEHESAQDAAETGPELPRRFDSSHARGVPDDWDLSRTAKPRLIEGLRRGMVGLTAGSRVTLYVPAALAWGDEGLPAAGVPPNADVLYEIELLEVLP